VWEVQLVQAGTMWKTEEVPGEVLGEHSGAAGVPKAGDALLLL